jgi:hypothetical protein
MNVASAAARATPIDQVWPVAGQPAVRLVVLAIGIAYGAWSSVAALDGKRVGRSPARQR